MTDQEARRPANRWTERVARLRDLLPGGPALLADLSLAVGVVVFHLLTWPRAMVLLPSGPVDAPPGQQAAAGALLATVLLLRRRMPLTVLLVLVAGGLAGERFGLYLWTVAGVGMVAASYSIGRHHPLARSLAALVVAVFADFASDAASMALAAAGHTLADRLMFTVVLVGAWWTGRLVRTRSFHLAELRSRAWRLERARDAHTRAVLAEERSRIARELHDVVAHHVSVMTVQATAARRVIDRDRDRAVQSLGEVESTGRQALADLRRLVGVLRTADSAGGERSPQPGMARLPELVRQVGETGMEVTLSTEGAPRALPPGLDLTLYRIAQESLTNALKHGGAGTRVAVTLGFTRGDVRLEVVDDGAGCAASMASDGDEPGHGLLGMAERAALFGGEFAVGPRDGGGFAVRCRFPLPAAPDPGQAGAGTMGA